MIRRAVPLLAAAALAAGCGGGESGQAPSASTPPVAAPSAAGAEQAMRARFAAKSLSIRYVRCVDEGVRTGGEDVFRCNVNFGEPHIEGYCVVVRAGRAVTQVEESSLRCRRTRTGDEP